MTAFGRDRLAVLAAVAVTSLAGVVLATAAVLLLLDLPRREHLPPFAVGAAVGLVTWAATVVVPALHHHGTRRHS